MLVQVTIWWCRKRDLLGGWDRSKPFSILGTNITSLHFWGSVLSVWGCTWWRLSTTKQKWKCCVFKANRARRQAPRIPLAQALCGSWSLTQEEKQCDILNHLHHFLKPGHLWLLCPAHQSRPVHTALQPCCAPGHRARSALRSARLCAGAGWWGRGLGAPGQQPVGG